MLCGHTSKYLRTGWLIILVATGLRLLYAGAFSIVPDEAYYWQWRDSGSIASSRLHRARWKKHRHITT